jgi:AcrR family transcriptional regulator
VARQGLDRARVVEAAARLADAEGLAALTLARVAADLGVRTPSLYNHVGGLEDLRGGVAVLGLRELTDTLRRAAVGRSGADGLHALAAAYRAYAGDHPGRYAAGAVAAPAAGDDDEHAAEAAEAVAVISAVLSAWDQGAEDAVHAERAVRSALHGFVALEAGGGFGLDVDVDESYRRLVAGLAAGLGIAPASR